MILLINYSHKWWYKALSVLLVIALILAISFGAAPRAHAVGVLTITVCAAILAVMAGAGIATVVSGMTSADIQNWMTGKLNEWDSYRNDGNVFTDLIQNNLITTTIKGTLAIGNGAARGISDFIKWLKDDLSLQNNNNINIYNSSYLNLLDYFQINSNNGFNIYDNVIVANSQQVCVLTLRSSTEYQSINNVEFDYTFQCTESGVNTQFCNVQSSNTNFQFTNLIGCAISAYGFPYSTSTNGSFHAKLYGNNLSYIQFETYSGRTGLVATINNLSINGDRLDLNSSLSLDTDVINIPSVADDGQTDIVIGIDGVYPGATTDEATDVIMDGVLDNTLDTTMTVTDEYVDAVEAVVINEQPISVNTDHHMIGFTNLPDFVNLNLNSIWHYVSDAVEYASGFISWFVNLLSSVPILAIPLYMSFTLLIVLSFIRRILL